MKKKILATIMVMALSLSMLAGCGTKAEDQAAQTETQTETQADTTAEASAQTEAGTEEASNDGLEQLEAVGDVEVDKGLFDVTLTIPKDFIGDVTQEQLDESVKEKGYQSATLNEDGSVTYVMTKAQHQEMLAGIKESIDKAMADMVGSENYPNITAVTANEDYTSFTITTKNAEPDMAEAFSVMGMYMYGGMYGIFAGEEVDNVHVDFVNADSGEIIESADSKDAGSSN